jgi:hypothetical protein
MNINLDLTPEINEVISVAMQRDQSRSKAQAVRKMIMYYGENFLKMNIAPVISNQQSEQTEVDNEQN